MAESFVLDAEGRILNLRYVVRIAAMSLEVETLAASFLGMPTPPAAGNWVVTAFLVDGGRVFLSKRFATEEEAKEELSWIGGNLKAENINTHIHFYG